MMRSLYLWNFMCFAHGPIYSFGSPDMEWPCRHIGLFASLIWLQPSSVY